jgi:hypothetical protein
MFVANGRLILPNLDASKSEPRVVQGQRAVFAECELLNSKYASIDTLVLGEKYVAGQSASFERALLFVTNTTRCRFALRGITSISVNDDLRITEMRDIFDPQHLATLTSNCAFPSIVDSTTAASTTSAVQSKDTESANAETAAKAAPANAAKSDSKSRKGEYIQFSLMALLNAPPPPPL